jgi:pimeloyl-ACP methyl ester carboxylesterase
MNKSLGDGCRMTVDANALVLHVDPDKLPHDIDSAKLATRIFTATAAPKATAAQAKHFGLFLPNRVHTDRPLVILIHGLDTDGLDWTPLASLLKDAGYEVGYFGYPDDQPIADDADLLAQQMAMFREVFPTVKVNLVTFSMGALVARSYVEGNAYLGEVDHLIMMAPPNHGSTWARWRILLEWKEHVQLAYYDRDWSPTWMITDGLGEAGRDLRPGSAFLEHLNALPRREGVRYTIIEGDQHPVRCYTASIVEGTEHLIPQRVAGWWGFRQTRSALDSAATSLHSHTDKSDGPVTLASASLPGVNDVVRVHSDHASIFRPNGNNPPAAWETIKDRLSR